MTDMGKFDGILDDVIVNAKAAASVVSKKASDVYDSSKQKIAAAEIRAEINAKLNETANAINMVAEAYPELRSSENFKQLQITVADVEEHLSASRRVYNANVSYYNQLIVKFPSSIVANSIGAKAEEFFQADDEKRSDVKMDFNS